MATHSQDELDAVVLQQVCRCSGYRLVLFLSEKTLFPRTGLLEPLGTNTANLQAQRL